MKNKKKKFYIVSCGPAVISSSSNASKSGKKVKVMQRGLTYLQDVDDGGKLACEAMKAKTTMKGEADSQDKIEGFAK